MKDAAMITLHGMGEVDDDYYEDLQDGVKKLLGKKWSKVAFHAVHYAEDLQKPQNALWKKMVNNEDNDLDCTRVRKFFLYGFGDAGSLEHSAQRDAVKYKRVQQQIQAALSKAFIDVGKDSTKPVIIVAHSLGCQVISNYLWDAAHNQHSFEETAGMDPDELNFIKLKSLRNLVTTGCNIPLFTSGLDKRSCFKAPNSMFRWDNYYDADDVLGWPLKQLDPSFNIVNDHVINAGGLFTSWNPLSHTKYWSDNDVIRPVAQRLLNLL